MAEVQLFTLGPWVYWFLINGASQPGGQDSTALLPLFDMLNHDARQEVSLQTSRCSYTVLQIHSRLCGHDTQSLVGGRRAGSVLEAAGKCPLPTMKHQLLLLQLAGITVTRIWGTGKRWSC